MQFTGTELTRSRSIYTQNLNFGWSIDCVVDNTTGRYDFGVSGSAGTLAFTLQSGRILAGNTFLHSYAANEPFSMECQITPTTYNLLKEDSPLVMGVGKTSGDFSTLFFTRAESTLFADFSFFASGQNLPNVTVDTVGYLLTTGQNAVTGQYRNLGSYPVRVFNSDALYTQGLSFGQLADTIPALGNGQFAFSGDFSSFNFANPVLVGFETNFEGADIAFTIVDARSQTSYVYLSTISTFNFESGVLNRTFFYNNYSGGFQVDSFPATISFQLMLVSGTGAFASAGGGGYTTTGYGNFIQSGLLTGIAATETGNILVSQFAWATGAVGQFFSGVGTGFATGIGYTGIATGFFTGLATGIIYNGSGTLLVSQTTGKALSSVVGLGVNIYATGLMTTSGVENLFFQYGATSNISPALVGDFGSGSPTFTRASNNGTIYWASGQDILYGISGMTSGYGITGYMTGEYLFLFATGVNTNGDFSNLFISNGGPVRYPGGDRNLTGADATHVATGYIDLSNPAYWGDFTTSFGIVGYMSRNLDCIYRPAMGALWKNDIYIQNGDQAYIGFYTSASSIVSGLNKFTVNQATGFASGNRVYLTARQIGGIGNFISISYNSYIGITGSTSFAGGSLSTYATGYIELLPYPVSAFVVNTTLEQIGYFNISQITGGGVFKAQRYPERFNDNRQQFRWLNSTDVVQAISGSFVGGYLMNGVASGSGFAHITSVIPGTGGNRNEFFQDDTLIVLKGGTTIGVGTTALAVGTYTGGCDLAFTGSGTYSSVLTQTGSVYYKTFTGTWDLYTGLSMATLATTKIPGGFTSEQILVTGSFPPNSQISFQVVHNLIDDRPDGARLIISGMKVLNAIDQLLSQP